MYQRTFDYESGVQGNVWAEWTSGRHQHRDGIESLETGRVSPAVKEERTGLRPEEEGPAEEVGKGESPPQEEHGGLGARRGKDSAGGRGQRVTCCQEANCDGDLATWRPPGLCSAPAVPPLLLFSRLLGT